MPRESIGTCGWAELGDGQDRIIAELELGICYIRYVCGDPPNGYDLDVIWEEHELGNYPSIGLTWDLPTDAPWDYISRAEDALSRFDEAVDWSIFDPKNEAEQPKKRNEIETTPNPIDGAP